MPSQSYSLEPNGPRNLTVSWKAMYKDMTVTYKDKVIGTFASQKDLSKGQDFRLPDGSKLHIQLVNKVFNTELQVTRNGLPLPGSASDPLTRLKNAYLMIYLIAGLNVVLGLLASLFKIPALIDFDFGFASIIFGLIFFLLGWLVSKRSLFALWLAIVLLVVDGLTGLVLNAAVSGDSGIGSFLARLILLVPMIQGLGAVKALRDQHSAD